MHNRILQVEDNGDDVLLTKLAFTKAGAKLQIDAVSDGDSALRLLESGYPVELPACVLLDIKLPGISGLEVLAWMRSHARFRRLPVIMLTSSVLREDIDSAYDLGANSYVIKPPDLNSLVSLAANITQYWLQTNTPGSTAPPAPRSPRHLFGSPSLAS